VVAANGIERGLIKMLAFWGEEAVLNLVLESKLDLAVFAFPKSELPKLDSDETITACISKWRKIHPDTVPVAAKACSNYLNGYLLRRDAKNRGFDTGISLDSDGFVAEGSIESIFIVQNGVLKTPPLGRILSSITRMSLLEVAPAVGIESRETPITVEELLNADEIFTCHTGIKVEPVSRIEDRQLTAPGPVTRKLDRLIRDIVEFKNDQFNHWFQPLK
jgi:branched-chain amino acid aminotransferase